MKRFENAEVGDLVWSEFHQQKGHISDIDPGCVSGYEIEATFDNGLVEAFLTDGRENDEHVIECLYYTDADGNKLTERPEPEIDWSKVEPGTLFEVKDFVDTYWHTPRKFRFFAEGKPWFDHLHMGSSSVTTWECVKKIRVVSIKVVG